MITLEEYIGFSYKLNACLQHDSTLVFGVLYSNNKPGFSIHHNFVHDFNVPLTFNQSASTMTDGSFNELSNSLATRFFSRR